MRNEPVHDHALITRYFRPMRRALFVLSVLLSACGSEHGNGDLCTHVFTPYPDLVSDRMRSPANGVFLDAMALYSQQDYAGATTGLEHYLRDRTADKSARLYLACCYLVLEKPFDAELQLDKLEQSSQKENFSDQCEWYTVVCWLCSDQRERALEGAQAIARAPRHTYKQEAAELVKAMTP